MLAFETLNTSTSRHRSRGGRRRPCRYDRPCPAPARGSTCTTRRAAAGRTRVSTTCCGPRSRSSRCRPARSIVRPWRSGSSRRAKQSARPSRAYAHYADSGRFAEFAALFAADGVLEVHGEAPLEGRDAIRAILEGVGASSSDVVDRAHDPPPRVEPDDRPRVTDRRDGCVLLPRGHRARRRPLGPLPRPLRARRRRRAAGCSRTASCAPTERRPADGPMRRVAPRSVFVGLERRARAEHVAVAVHAVDAADRRPVLPQPQRGHRERGQLARVRRASSRRSSRRPRCAARARAGCRRRATRPCRPRSISPRIATIASTKRSSSPRSSDSVGSIISVPATGNDIVGAWKP